MAVEKQKKYTLIARGGSHLRYFKTFSQQTALNVSVVSIKDQLFPSGYVRYWNILKHIDIDALLLPHLSKKAQKHKELNSSFIWPLFEKLSRLLIKIEVVKSAAIIDKEKADVVGVWNGQKQPGSSIASAAKALNKEVVFFENGLFPNSTTCDWSGVNCENSLPNVKEFYRPFHDDKALPCELVPRKPICEKAMGIKANALPERYIFVPFQVETDSQIISNSPWIRSMGQLYQHLINVIDKMDDSTLHIVIKEHPSDPVRHDAFHHKHKRILFANQCSTQELIERSVAVMTVNSTVGIESLLLDKPVVVLGKACYGIEGIATLVSSESEMLAVLNNIEAVAPDTELKCGYLNFLYSHYIIPTSWRDLDDRHVEALTNRLLKQDSFTYHVNNSEALLPTMQKSA